jgi:hypothetical protein
LAVDLVGEIGRLDTGIATADRRISTTVAAKPLWSMAEAASFDDDLGGRVLGAARIGEHGWSQAVLDQK